MKGKQGHDYSNEEILDGIIRGDPAVFRFVTGNVLPFLLKYMGKEGNRRLAELIIQDAYVIVFRKLSSSGLVINCRFLTFFIGICKRIWLFENRTREKEVPVREELFECDNLDVREIGLLWTESREFRLYRHHFEKLKEKQKWILEASLNGVPYRDLYLEFGYNSIEAFKNEVYRIKKRLYNRICADPEYRKLQNRSKWCFDEQGIQ